MTMGLVNPTDPPERQIEKLLTIAGVLMRRVEQITDDSGAAYAQFQRAAMLEDQVRERTRDLEHALDLLNESNGRLAAANRETEAARQNLSNAIETIQEGFALFDAQDVLVLCNSRFGMHMLDVRDHLRPGLTFADYVDRVSRSRFLELPAGETPQDWAVARHRRHQDQHVIFNVRMVWDRWVQVSEHRTAGGGTVILQTEVTELIRLERQERGKMLDEQARVIRATLDHLSQGVCIFDDAAHLVGWNQRLVSLLALPLARLRMGAGFDHVIDALRPDFRFGDGMTAARLGAWVQGPGARVGLRFEMRRGPDMILDVFAEGMPGGGFVMSFTDVTAERAAIEALSRANETLEARVMARTLELEDALGNAERANASRSRFVAAASHDVLQPLSAAKLFLSSIADDGLTPGARSALEKAENALLSVEGILGALLDISKLESGRAAVSVGPVALDRLLAQLNDEFGAIAAAKGLRLTVVPSHAVVVSDAGYLRRILQNLIGNAIRYTDAGRVLVGARRQAGIVRLEVHDTGPGIPEDEQDNIFKEFHRLNARASASEGMGLGLAIVERACGLLGHPLGLQSTVGRGTSFMVQVPLAETLVSETGASDTGASDTGASDTGASDTGAVESMAPVAARGPRPSVADRIVFLVESDGPLRRAMAHLLEKWGVNVLEADSAEAALDLIDELGILPDCFVVDHALGPGMDGLTFLKTVQARHRPVAARIITADHSAMLAEAAAALGVGVLYKPIEPRALERFLVDLPQG